MRLTVTLTYPPTGAKTAVKARPPNIHGGIWVISERARRAAFRRIGAESSELANPGVTSSATVRAIDADGWHTYTLWGS